MNYKINVDTVLVKSLPYSVERWRNKFNDREFIGYEVTKGCKYFRKGDRFIYAPPDEILTNIFVFFEECWALKMQIDMETFREMYQELGY